MHGLDTSNVSSRVESSQVEFEPMQALTNQSLYVAPMVSKNPADVVRVASGCTDPKKSVRRMNYFVAVITLFSFCRIF